ncbi:mucin-5AC-like isoform X2 [Polypterus senegalus]|uniref:mucin-5AC-like isoform X2 n=1 Tax=Polypterus senegalus TaxID=55291 RepID=UPI001964CEF7|nr:mucin-5AC-like isoform X2 [Polypterus senegalus]
MSAAGMLVFLVSWSVLSIGLASHMQGGIMTFTPKGRNRDGTYRVDFRYKESFRSNCHQEFYWGCNSGDCGYTRELQYGQIDSSPLGDSWCQAEGFMSRSVPSDKPFDLREYSCCWVNNLYGYPSWMLLTHVDLGVRSDTRNPNRSPVTTLPPKLRVPQNCPTTYSLLAHDPDGDLVKCRYGQSYNSECYTCAQQAGFGLNEISCKLSYYGSQTGVYMFELVMEDFPQRHIQLQYSDGSSVGKAPLYLVRRHKKSLRTSSYATTSSNWGGWNGQLTTATPYTSAPFNWGGWNGQSTTAAPYTTTPAPWWWLWNGEPSISVPYTTAPSTWWWPTTVQTTTAAPSTSTPNSWWGSTTVETTTAAPSTSTPNSWWGSTTVETTTTAPYTTTPGSWWWWGWWNGQQSMAVPYTTASSPYTTKQIGWSSTIQTSTYLLYTQPANQDPLSKIPVQFLVEVTSSVPSCNFGDYRPQYLSPTPLHGQIKKASVNRQFQFIVRAQASYAVIQNIMISGPLNITKSYQYDSQTQTGKAVVTWTPSENNLGESVPICFFAETQEGYQSELRCIVVTVGRRNSLPMNIETSIVCTKTTMSVFVLKSSAPGLNEHYMRLNDPRCSLTSNSTHLIASVSLNSCGTRYQENDTEIIFENEDYNI